MFHLGLDVLLEAAQQGTHTLFVGATDEEAVHQAADRSVLQLVLGLTVTVSDPYLTDTASVAVVVTDVYEPEPEPRFIDVPTTHTFYADIEWLAAAGITTGCNPPTNDMFCPAAAVTRGQMAAFLARALDLPAAGDDIEFVDDDGSIFEDDIERLAAAGITRGCNPPTNDRFCPNDPVTRGQMAAFLHRALG